MEILQNFVVFSEYMNFNPTKIEEWWLFKFDVFDVEDELPAFGSEDFPTPEKNE